MKLNHALIILGCCLLVVAILLSGRSAVGVAGARSDGSRVGPAFTGRVGQEDADPSSRRRSKSSQRDWMDEAPTSTKVSRVLKQMDRLVLEVIDLDPDSPGATGAINVASLRLRDELFVEFREAGGTRDELLDWLSGVTARGGQNEYALERIISDSVLEASNTLGRAAVDWLVSQPDSDLISTELFEQATQSWLRFDRNQALEWLDQNMDRFEEHGVRFVMSEWPQDDVEGAREWVEARMVADGDSVHPSYVSDVARMWASQDPAGAYEWMFSLDERWHDWGLMGVVQGLPDEDLPEAADWLRQNRDIGRVLDDTRGTLANRIAGSDPRTAIDVAIDITNIAESDRAIITAARILYRREPQLVLDWLPGSGLTETAQAAILSDK